MIKNSNNEEKLDNVVRWTITLPISTSISVEINRKDSNCSKSSWVKSAIEEKLKRIKDKEEEKNELKTISSDIAILKNAVLEIKKYIK